MARGRVWCLPTSYVLPSSFDSTAALTLHPSFTS